jgi:hypothetical protein
MLGEIFFDYFLLLGGGCFDTRLGLGYPSDEESDDKYEREFDRRFEESVSESDDESEFVVPEYVFTEFDIFCNNL